MRSPQTCLDQLFPDVLYSTTTVNVDGTTEVFERKVMMCILKHLDQVCCFISDTPDNHAVIHVPRGLCQSRFAQCSW